MSQPPGADNELGNETGPRQRAAGTPRRGNWPRQPHAARCLHTRRFDCSHRAGAEFRDLVDSTSPGPEIDF